jgi:iron complex outermembrane recepter protein
VSQQINFGGSVGFRSYGLNNYFDYLGVPNIDIFNPAPALAAPLPTARGAARGSRQTTRNGSAYVQDTVKLFGGKVQVMGGLRFNDFLSNSGARPVQNTPLPTAFGNKTVGNYSVLVQPFPNTTVYASHQEMYRLNFGTDYLGNPQIPSVGINNEFGAKIMFFNGQLLLTLTRFDLSYTNQYSFFTQGAGDPKPGELGVRLGGEQTNKGYQVTAAASTDLGPGAINGVVTAYTGDVKDQNGQKPAGPVNNTASILASYRFKKGPLNGLTVGGSARYQGERVGLGFAASSGYATRVRYPEYTMANFMLGYQWRRYDIQLNVDNIGDNIEIAGSEGPLWMYTDPGRFVKLTLRYSY